MNTEILFVGGPADGERKDVPHNQHVVRVAIFQPIGIRRPSEERAWPEETMRSAVYRRASTIGGEVMLHEGMDAKDAMKLLIDGYRPGTLIKIERDEHVSMNSREWWRSLERGGRPEYVLMKEPYDPDRKP